MVQFALLAHSVLPGTAAQAIPIEQPYASLGKRRSKSVEAVVHLEIAIKYREEG